MKDGTYIPAYLPYGYESINRRIQINKGQADVVQKIFSDFLVGRSTEQIAANLRVNNIPCKNGRAQWDSSSVRYILRNEKYTGNSKWQKYYTPSTFPFHCKINAGEASATGQRERIRQSFRSRNTNWRKNCWKADRNESPKGITKHTHCAKRCIADRVAPYFEGKKSMQTFTGYA